VTNRTRELFISQLETRLNARLGPRDLDWGSFPTPDMSFATWLRDGGVFIHMDESSTLEVRVPLVSGLSISPDILDWISSRNSNQYAGHYWLRPGADENHWQLVCALKFPWDWMDQSLADVILQTCPGLGTVLNRDIAPEFMQKFGGEPWWDTTYAADKMGAQVLALLD
jgi:hypothetical protein